jgi:superfamily I DNA/RNA helicase
MWSHPLRIFERVIDGGAMDLLEGLTGPQQDAVRSNAAPLCIVAAAGAGKTRVLTRRIAYRGRTGLADPAHTLALTFTRKAAGELQQRLGVLGLRGGVNAGTFHSVALAQLQRWWSDRRQCPPTLLEQKARLLGPLVEGRPGLENVPVSEVGALIDWAQARTVAPEDLEAAVAAHGRALPTRLQGGVAAVAAVYARYESEKRRRGLVDFDDLLLRLADALDGDPEFAGAQRWRWRHIYIDEFQDLNPLQHRLLTAWLGSSIDLCVVGDPDQAIYGWNGADPGLLAALPEHWPSTEVVRLDANHRCSEPIVRGAAAVLGPDGDRLCGVQRPGPAPQVTAYESDRAEARAIAAALVATRREGREWQDMAVLTRTNSQLAVLREALGLVGVPSWSANPDAGDGRPEEAVTLSSFHRAKGLEWSAVWVAGVEEGLVPMGRAVGPAAEQEERRLLYVALTRAADEVHVSWAASRYFGGRPVPRRPSRWLEAVAQAAEAAGPPPAPPAAGSGPVGPGWWADQRAALRESAARSGRPRGRRTPAGWPEADDELRRALVAWRSEAARHSGVPPQMVLHDATVEALACMRPHTMDDLLAIPGFGPVRAARYGPVLLHILGQRAASA